MEGGGGLWAARARAGRPTRASVPSPQAYDTPIPGYATPTVGNLRLWEALPSTELDLAAFNEGRFEDAVASARRAAEVSAVLYPNDATEDGKLLRLKQQYFFVSASLQVRAGKTGEERGRQAHAAAASPPRPLPRTSCPASGQPTAPTGPSCLRTRSSR